MTGSCDSSWTKAVNLMIGLGTAIAGSGCAASVMAQDYPACSADRLGGADLILLKRAIVKGAQLNSSPDGAGRFFEANQIVVATARLRAGRSDFIAYVRGPGFCGTSGCPALVIEQVSGPAGPRYRTLTRLLPARLPISALPTTHHGARDLGVSVEGGGIRRGYTGALVFDGKSYASNPSLAGVRHVKPSVGQVILGSPGAASSQCRLR